MEEYNLIKHSVTPIQGTSAYTTPLTESLRIDYFKAEPRNIRYWLEVIKDLADDKFEYGMVWTSLLPPGMELDLIAEYIKNPKEAIAAGRFSSTEIDTLREPQRILLFYFLKKISSLEVYNEKIIEEINNKIARFVLLQEPYKAVPDQGFGIIPYAPDTFVLIDEGLSLDAVVEGEIVTRKYNTTSKLTGELMNLNRCIMAFPTDDRNSLLVEDQALPLVRRTKPFRKNKYANPELAYNYSPSLIISSSVLCLREGLRKINICIKLNGVEPNEELDFTFKITTRDGWVQVPVDTGSIQLVPIIKLGNDYQYQILISEDFPPIAPIENPNAEEAIVSEKSCLMLYCDKKDFIVAQIDLNVEVNGMNPAAIRNQEVVLNSSDNYALFGSQSGLGSAFTFGHPELTHPAISNITIDPVWVSKPKNLSSYYRAYGKKEENFGVEITTCCKSPDAVKYTVNDDGKFRLFGSSITFDANIRDTSHRGGCGQWNADELDPLNHNVYFQLKLIGQDFGVSQYPLLMMKYSIDLNAYENASAKVKKSKTVPVEVNMPYHPMVSSLKINYTSLNVSWKNNELLQDSGEKNSLHVYFNMPKGYAEYKGEDNGKGIGLGDNKNGAVYFGFENLTANSTSILYFNGRTGNARAEQAVVQWWYLSKDSWEPLKIINDETNGLTEEGLFTWEVIEGYSNDTTLMPKGSYWIKCTLKQLPEKDRTRYISAEGKTVFNDNCVGKSLSFQDSIIQLTGIYANGLCLRRNIEELDISDNVTSLPAGSELTFSKGEPEHKVVLPFLTMGGVDRETELEFWARVFTRVKTKERMVSNRDFESILLHEFRNIALVKCIPRKEGRKAVEVVVINQQVYGELPYSISRYNSKAQLEKIQTQMLSLSSPFYGKAISLKAKNPCYRLVGFKIHLQYVEGTVATENEVLIYEALRRFITPWMFEKDQTPLFGLWFDYSELMAYLQSLPYVKSILDINMGLFQDERIFFPTEEYRFGEDEILYVGKPSIIYIEDNLAAYERIGIGVMELGDDFYVSDENGDVPSSNSDK